MSEKKPWWGLHQNQDGQAKHRAKAKTNASWEKGVFQSRLVKARVFVSGFPHGFEMAVVWLCGLCIQFSRNSKKTLKTFFFKICFIFV